jgi:peroxiredoxin
MRTLRKSPGIGLAIILLTVLVILTACSGGGQPLKIDGPVPNFKLQDYTGKTVSLSDFKGKAVLLHYWETDFAACVDEMVHLQAIHEDWQKEGKAVLLTINAVESASTIQAFMESHNYTFPVLLDTDAAVARKYNVTMVPTSIFIDKDGKLKLNVVGPFKDKAAIEKQLAAYMP